MYEVILLEKIRNLGALGKQVKVKPGYGRNYLIPQGKAVRATKENIAKFEVMRAELEKKEAEKTQQALTRQEALSKLDVIVIAVKASEEGKLFGSVGSRDVAELITQAGVPVEKREVQLSEGVLRHVGEYDITIELESDVTATVKFNIVNEAH